MLKSRLPLLSTVRSKPGRALVPLLLPTNSRSPSVGTDGTLKTSEMVNVSVFCTKSKFCDRRLRCRSSWPRSSRSRSAKTNSCRRSGRFRNAPCRPSALARRSCPSRRWPIGPRFPARAESTAGRIRSNRRSSADRRRAANRNSTRADSTRCRPGSSARAAFAAVRSWTSRIATESAPPAWLATRSMSNVNWPLPSA